MKRYTTKLIQSFNINVLHFQLEKSLGISPENRLVFEKDRDSDPALETRIRDGVADLKQIKELNEEKRKSTKRKEFIMSELLETERTYVKVSLGMKISYIRIYYFLGFGTGTRQVL